MKTRAEIFGENLKRLLQEKQISRKEFAEMLNVTVVAVGTYINGKREPSLDKIFEMANLLKVSVASIIGENNFEVRQIDSEQTIFKYRYQRALQMAEDFLDALPPKIEKDYITVYSPKRLETKNGIISYYEGYNAVQFAKTADFINCMERTERKALQERISFNEAFRRTIFIDEC